MTGRTVKELTRLKTKDVTERRKLQSQLIQARKKALSVKVRTALDR